MDLSLAARFPFLRGASALVGVEGPSLEELLSDRAYESARRRGRERLVASVRDGEIPVEGLPPRAKDPSDRRLLLDETLAYGYARILVSATGDKYVVRRHAVAESKRATRHLEGADPGTLAAVAAEFSMDAEPVEAEGGARLRLPFAQYLRWSVHVKDTAYKLSSQPLAAGLVTVPARAVARLAEEALRRRIEGELPLPVPAEVEQALARDLAPVAAACAERKSQMQAAEFGEVDLALLPPCMKHILAQLQAGENAAHSARFAITSFLHTVGLDADEIIKLFSQAPDFREDLTRYQVEHITGVSSGTEYTPPGCNAMKTYGICYNPDDWCHRRNREGELYVTHPLSYYRWALKRKARAGGTPAPQTPA